MKISKLRILTLVSIITIVATLISYNPKIYSKLSAPNVATTEPLTQPIKMTTTTNIKLLGAKVVKPKVPVVITFDDGYVDNYTLAYPLLKANNQKATVFMIKTQKAI